VFTYSRRVIETVGHGVMQFSPLSALVVVLAHSIVLFLFASQGLEHFLASHGLPTIPLVPVSSSQAVVGAIIGIGLVRGAGELRFKVLGNIAAGWVATPILAGALTFVSLFFVENVFRQQVVKPRMHGPERAAVERLDPRATGRATVRELPGHGVGRTAGQPPSRELKSLNRGPGGRGADNAATADRRSTRPRPTHGKEKPE
jgi:phosphate/sulfate permease